MSSVLKWGVPPLANMAFAGHTENSADVQTALGYARVTYNIGVIMVMLGAFKYFQTVIPGCIGADRKDRIPTYLRRSMLLCVCLMLPFWVAQLFAAHIVEGVLGASPHIGGMVATYCRTMILGSLLMLVEIHVECMFVNLGFAKCAAFNALFTGLGVDILCSFTFVYYYDLGTFGAALTQIVVRIIRLLVWAVLMFWFELVPTMITNKSVTGEQIINRGEVQMFCKLGAPQLASNFAGWFVFELQLMILARISGITAPALAAGAIWVMLEQCMTAVQMGWIQITSMRSLVLLGKLDPGAQKAHMLISLLGFSVVALTSLPLLMYPDGITQLLTNDRAVQGYLEPMIWMLAVHSQLRIGGATGGILFIPLGKPWVKLIISYCCNYLIALPVATGIALTDIVTTNVQVKMLGCVSCASIAAAFTTVISHSYLCCMDWHQAGIVINSRANTDKSVAPNKVEEGVNTLEKNPANGVTCNSDACTSDDLLDRSSSHGQLVVKVN